MFIRIIIVFLSLFFSTQSQAVDCYFTLVKDSCWINYDLTVKVMQADTREVILTLNIPKGKTFVRQKFACKPALRMLYEAQFTPIFWESGKNRTYLALRYWSLPANIGPTDVAWEVPVCFTRDFAGVPFPPDAEGQCQCNFDAVPPIKSLKLSST